MNSSKIRLEKEIPYKLVKDVYAWDFRILTRQDSERYLRTIGVSTCTGIALDFPQNGVIVLSHVRANNSLHWPLQEIKKSLEGRVDGQPFYFIEIGPSMLNYSGKTATPDMGEIVKQYFPGANPSSMILHDRLSEEDDSIDLMVDKETGIIHVFNTRVRGAYDAKESDFQFTQKPHPPSL